MADTTPTPAILDGRWASSRAMQPAFLWTLASLATACGLYGLAALVSLESDREAGRALAAAGDGSGYVAALAVGFTAHHGRPNRY